MSKRFAKFVEVLRKIEKRLDRFAVNFIAPSARARYEATARIRENYES